MILVSWNRIRIGVGNNDPQKNKDSTEMCIFEVLNVLFCELEASPVTWCPSWRPRDKYSANFETKIMGKFI
jgi:hypothetical protein